MGTLKNVNDKLTNLTKNVSVSFLWIEKTENAIFLVTLVLKCLRH